MRGARSRGQCRGSRPARDVRLAQRIDRPWHGLALSDDRGASSQMPTRPVLRRSRTTGMPSCSARSTTAIRKTMRAPAATTQLTWRRYSDLDFDLYNFREIDAARAAVLPDLRQETSLCRAGAPHVDDPRRWPAGAVLLSTDRRRQHESARATTISVSVTRPACTSTSSTGGRPSLRSTWRSSTTGAR